MFVVDDDSSRIAKDEEAPDQDIASCGSALICEAGGKSAEKSLAQESYEGCVAEYPQCGGDEIFMEGSRAEEHHDHGLELGPAGLHHRKVEMVYTPLMYWQVPPPPKLLQCRGIPPRLEEDLLLTPSEVSQDW